MLKFSRGHNVRLKTGGPGMKVLGYSKPLSVMQLFDISRGRKPRNEEVKPTIVICEWFDAQLNYSKGEFDEELLEFAGGSIISSPPKPKVITNLSILTRSLKKIISFHFSLFIC